MLSTPLMYLLVITILLWVIRNPIILLILNLVVIFVIIDFESYFDMSGITASAVYDIIAVYVGVAVIGWGILIHQLIKARKKALGLLDDQE